MNVGDVVRLKSGGPIMTITGIVSEWTGLFNRKPRIAWIWCSWFDQTDRCRKETFAPEQLEPQARRIQK
jgi:uncharacterized protein YodC (DUF2158 family)